MKENNLRNRLREIVILGAMTVASGYLIITEGIGNKYKTSVNIVYGDSQTDFYSLTYEEGIPSFGFSNQDFPINRKNQMTFKRRGINYTLIDSEDETSINVESEQRPNFEKDELESIITEDDSGNIGAYAHNDTSIASRELFRALNPLYNALRDSVRSEGQRRIMAREKKQEEHNLLEQDYRYFEDTYQKIADVLISRTMVSVQRDGNDYSISMDIQENLPRGIDKISDLEILYNEGFFKNEIRIDPLSYYFPGKPEKGSSVYIRFNLRDLDTEESIAGDISSKDNIERISIEYLALSDTNHNRFSHHEFSFEYYRSDATEETDYGRHVREVFHIFDPVYNAIRNPIDSLLKKQSRERLEQLEIKMEENLTDFNYLLP